ncbi:MAG: PEP-CTERM sorting domain-containing protein [Nitrospiraceae bacterium]|nr:MAG: PEP-CTERM sorting domain-containing protein [Nitrospiraceae bacterium]
METKMKKQIIITSLVAVLIASMVSFGQATMISINLDTEFSGATPPAGTAPWLTATFDDAGTPGSVMLTMSTANLTGTEFVSTWSFNLNPALNPVSLNFAYSSGEMFSSLTQGVNCCKADGDGFFDISFNFNNGAFTSGETSVFNITGIPTLTALDFDFLSLGSGNSPDGLKTAAHVQSIGVDGNDSGWITGETTVVPEPGTVFLLGAGLVGLGLYGRKRFRK